jgi:hypothetical protein
MNLHCVFGLAGGLSLSGAVFGATADFDHFAEGILYGTFEDNGITFYEFDRRLQGDPNWFVCEQADGDLGGDPYFTTPNTLGFGGWVPGPYMAYSRCGEFKMTTGQVETFASLEFWGGSEVGNGMTLEAYLDGELNGTTIIEFPPYYQHYTVAISGVQFDTLRLNGWGPAHDGCFFAVVDHVVIGSDCPADFDGDGDVDTADLLYLLAAWGTPDGDVDGDNDTDTADLLALLAAWGECP